MEHEGLLPYSQQPATGPYPAKCIQSTSSYPQFQYQEKE